VSGARVHTIVAGGMPGWQIALIAAAAALAAAVAVLLDRGVTGSGRTCCASRQAEPGRIPEVGKPGSNRVEPLCL
jgi:hypothetical protein